MEAYRSSRGRRVARGGRDNTLGQLEQRAVLWRRGIMRIGKREVGLKVRRIILETWSSSHQGPVGVASYPVYDVALAKPWHMWLVLTGPQASFRCWAITLNVRVLMFFIGTYDRYRIHCQLFFSLSNNMPYNTPSTADSSSKPE